VRISWLRLARKIVFIRERSWAAAAWASAEAQSSSFGAEIPCDHFSFMMRLQKN
jgi:hypothetical protein